jgi:uridine phosphorylase
LQRHLPGARAGTIASVDLFYDPPGRAPGAAATLSQALSSQALAVEMEAATIFTIGAQAGIGVGCVLAVSDTFAPDGSRRRIDDHDLLAAVERIGAGAVAALAS